MSYNPRYTPLLAATEWYGEGRWGIASGIDVPLEQAFTQISVIYWEAGAERRDVGFS
jgi:hypothetical protein